MKDEDKGRSHAVLVAICSLLSLDREAPPKSNFRTLVGRMSVRLDRSFARWRTKGAVYMYLGNGTGDRSQIWSKVSSSVVLLIYIVIVIFAKNPT